MSASFSKLSSFVGKNFETWSGNVFTGPSVTEVDLDFNSRSNIVNVFSPTANITLTIENFPVFSGFNNKVITYTVIVNQGTTPRSLNTITLQGTNGTSKSWGPGTPNSIMWLDGTTPLGNASSVDFFNIILVNNNLSLDGSSLDQYDIFANLNGPYM